MCWGVWNGSNSGSGSQQVPTLFDPDPAHTWTKLVAGGLTTLALRDDGTLWCWGGSQQGQCTTAGNDSFGNQVVGPDVPPAQVVGPASGWIDASVHQMHACGVGADNTLWCWGSNVDGQLGLGDHTGHLNPTQVGAGADWQTVTVGVGHTCATKQDGSLWCWGRFEALGDGSNIAETLPILTGYLTGSAHPQRDGFVATDWMVASAGLDSTCAGRADGTLYCFGTGYALGNGTSFATEIAAPVLPCIPGGPAGSACEP